MNILPINDPAVLELATEEIHQRPILVQLPTVFVLLAAPTAQGAHQLDATKTRLAGKNYGTAIGSLDRFIAQAEPQMLPDEFNCAARFRALTGTFIRLSFHHPTIQSKTLRNGTHQGLLLGGPYAALFSWIEESFESRTPEAMWNYRNYSAPLCTSCNVSGDPEGSIVAYDKALLFAQTRDIRLFITTTEAPPEKGSYPIFGFQKDQVSIHRDGPGLDRFKELIPENLRSWR
ncbi:hypothetical protein [Larkinella ripae]